LANWVAKTVAYQPGDVLALMAGTNDPFLNFQEAQRSNLDSFPAALITPSNKAKLLTAVNSLNAKTVLYQGHGSWSYLNKLDDQMLASQAAESYAPSCWVMGTCNAALYHRPADTLMEQGRDLCLVYKFLRAANAGAVAVIACPTLADATELEDVTVDIIAKINHQPHLTWGGLLQGLKKDWSFLITVQLYSLFGDPLTPVMSAAPRKLTVDDPVEGAFLDLTEGRARARLGLNFAGVWSPDAAVVLEYQLNGGVWQVAALAESITPGSNQSVTAYWDTRALALRETDSGALWVTTVNDGLTVRWSRSATFAFELQPEVDLENWLYENGQATLTASVIDPLGDSPGSYSFLIKDYHTGETIADSDWISSAAYSFAQTNGALPRTVVCRYRDSIGNLCESTKNLVFDEDGDLDRDGRTNQEEFEAGTDPEAIDIALIVGWNPISLPHAVDDNVWQAIVAHSTGAVWQWTAGSYQPIIAQPARLQGIWLLSTKDEIISCARPPTGTEPMVLVSGWNFGGPPELAGVPTDAPVQAVWGYRAGYVRRIEEMGRLASAALKPGKAYWFFSLTGGDLAFEPTDPTD